MKSGSGIPSPGVGSCAAPAGADRGVQLTGGWHSPANIRRASGAVSRPDDGGDGFKAGRRPVNKPAQGKARHERSPGKLPHTMRQAQRAATIGGLGHGSVPNVMLIELDAGTPRSRGRRHLAPEAHRILAGRRKPPEFPVPHCAPRQGCRNRCLRPWRRCPGPESADVLAPGSEAGSQFFS